jgi:hypothetical protein
MVAITMAWIASIFAGVTWYNGHRFRTTVDAGAIGILRADWHPSLRPSFFRFELPGERSINQFWALCPSVEWYSNQQWIAIPMWVMLVACAAPLVVPELRRYKRSKSSHECFRCGYSLDGLQARTCPECGAKTSGKRPPLKFSLLLLACLIIPLSLMVIRLIW